MRVSVVAQGLLNSNQRLQPWRYLTEVAVGLAAVGHEVEFLTDTPIDALELPGVAIWRAATGSGVRGEALAAHLRSGRPDVVLWNTGVTSALRSRPPILPGTRQFAVFTSPLYGAREIGRLGLAVLMDARSYAMHGIGSLVPRRRLAAYLASSFEGVVVLGRSAAAALVKSGLPADLVHLVPPGRDLDVETGPHRHPAATSLVTFVFAGSPAHIRGADLVVRAFADAWATAPNARLMVLSRHDRPSLALRTESLVRLAESLRIQSVTEFVEGTLPRADFVAKLAAADVMVLPFRIVPSEAPLAVLEAAGAGLPLIASDLAPIRDLAAPESVLVPAGSRKALTAAIVRFATDADARTSAAGAAQDWYAAWPTWAETSRRMAAATGLDERTARSAA
jgi:phosphatidylinositol alpha-1,6-mannosyltransferase